MRHDATASIWILAWITPSTLVLTSLRMKKHRKLILEKLGRRSENLN
jgi:hypothetical protein